MLQCDATNRTATGLAGRMRGSNEHNEHNPVAHK
jgi:hypothetical protein